MTETPPVAQPEMAALDALIARLCVEREALTKRINAAKSERRELLRAQQRASLSDARQAAIRERSEP